MITAVLVAVILLIGVIILIHNDHVYKDVDVRKLSDGELLERFSRILMSQIDRGHKLTDSYSMSVLHEWERRLKMDKEDSTDDHSN